MAARYAYFIRGDQIALVEKADTAEDYSSPTKAVTAGLKFEYVKRPLITSDSAGDSEQTGIVDESEYLQVNEYLATALVYYIKARYLEDQGQFKESEYLMAKFRKQVEKYSNSLIGGPRMIASGPHAIR